MARMAESVAVASNAKLYVHGNFSKQPFIVLGNSRIQTRRKYCYGSCKTTQLPFWNASKFIVHHSRNGKKNLHKERAFRCHCLGALPSAEDAINSEWIPLFDRGLLIVSMLLTYMAGVIPVGKAFPNAQKTTSSDETVPESSCYSGSAMNSDNEVNLLFAWDKVGKKLMDSLSAVEGGLDVGNNVSEVEENYEKRPSSLSALAAAPRLRLLWTCFGWLKKEVHNISEDSDNVSIEDISLVFKQIIQNSYQPLCMSWLEEELRLKNRKYEKAVFSLMVDKLNGYDDILQNIKKLGKEDLYTELICILRFGSIRKSGYYGHSLFSLHLVDVLEDLVITLADGIARMYLELISVDSSMSNEVNSLGLSLCTLSTRALQKLRNEVAMHQWFHQNMEVVVSMYEDRFELFTLQSQFHDESREKDDENFKWWKKLRLNRSEPVSSPLCSVVINHISVTVKRTKELRALTGWRYYFSLYLELSDIAMPLIRTVIAKVSDAISFFLVYLIGRSLGLIYSGIRQSLRWK